MAKKVQFLVHQLDCKCGETEFIYRNVFDSPKSNFNLARDIVKDIENVKNSSQKRIFLTKVNDTRCVYLCVLKITQGYTEEDWKILLDKVLNITKNLKSISLFETLGCCSCCDIKFNALKYIKSQKKDLDIQIIKDFSNSTYRQVELYDFTYNYMLKRFPTSWRGFFDENRKVLQYISDGILERRDKVIYPPLKLIYRVFELCPLDEIKVIIVGQDPYPNNPGEAMGIAFSVPDNIKTPMSLVNIKKKVVEAGYTANSNDLTKWVRQGVFLINTALTVEAKDPLSHANIWASFTTRLVIWLNFHLSSNIVWVLWGEKAHNYEKFIKKGKIVKGPHPVARGGLWNNQKIFVDIDNALKSIDLEIDWNL